MLVMCVPAATVSRMFVRLRLPRMLAHPLTLSAGMPALFLATAALTSVRTLRRLGALPAGLPDLPGSRGRTRFAGDEVAFRYYSGADPGRAPVVLLHGWGQSGDSAFFSVLPGLRRPFLVPDLPGHGESTTVDVFSFEACVDAVIAAMDAAGIERAHLLGHSMGGALALATVRSHPDRFLSLTVVASAMHWQSPRMTLPLRFAPLLTARVSPVTLRKLTRRIREVPAYSEALVWSWRNRPSPRTLRGSADALRRFDARAWDLRPPPSRWVVPLDDQLVRPSRQRRAASAIAAEVVEVRGAGHSFFIADPETLIELIENPPRR